MVTTLRFLEMNMAVAEHRYVNTDHTAMLCEDGNGNAVYRKAIEHTEFPLLEITLYFTNNLILLPSEN